MTGAGRGRQGAPRGHPRVSCPLCTGRTERHGGRPRALPERSGSNSQQGLEGRGLGTSTGPLLTGWAEEAQSDAGQRPPMAAPRVPREPAGRARIVALSSPGWKTPALGSEPASAARPLPGLCAGPGKHWDSLMRCRSPATAGEGRGWKGGRWCLRHRASAEKELLASPRAEDRPCPRPCPAAGQPMP